MVVVTPRCPAFGTEPSGYSSAAGSVEENNLTGIRACAMHRGQDSTVNQLTFGLILSPQRGQFRNDEAWSGIASTKRSDGSRAGARDR
jgi:hypothetical protein